MREADERLLVTSNTGKKHPYYLCIAKGCQRYCKSVRREVIETAFSDLLKQLVPSPKLVELARAMFKDAWQQRGTQTAQVAENYNREKTKIEKEFSA